MAALISLAQKTDGTVCVVVIPLQIQDVEQSLAIFHVMPS